MNLGINSEWQLADAKMYLYVIRWHFDHRMRVKVALVSRFRLMCATEVAESVYTTSHRL